MSATRWIIETPCEHGALETICVFNTEGCLGGSRLVVELPDMEKLREAVAWEIREDEFDPHELSVLRTFAAAARWVLGLESE